MLPRPAEPVAAPVAVADASDRATHLTTAFRSFVDSARQLETAYNALRERAARIDQGTNPSGNRSHRLAKRRRRFPILVGLDLPAAPARSSVRPDGRGTCTISPPRCPRPIGCGVITRTRHPARTRKLSVIKARGIPPEISGG